MVEQIYHSSVNQGRQQSDLCSPALACYSDKVPLQFEKKEEKHDRKLKTSTNTLLSCEMELTSVVQYGQEKLCSTQTDTDKKCDRYRLALTKNVTGTDWH